MIKMISDIIIDFVLDLGRKHKINLILYENNYILSDPLVKSIEDIQSCDDFNLGGPNSFYYYIPKNAIWDFKNHKYDNLDLNDPDMLNKIEKALLAILNK